MCPLWIKPGDDNGLFIRDLTEGFLEGLFAGNIWITLSFIEIFLHNGVKNIWKDSGATLTCHPTLLSPVVI
jgi:hypothetical protein